MRRLLVALCLTLTLLVSPASAEAPIPTATTGNDYIVDDADILSDAQEASLNTKLTDYEKRTSVEIGVLTVSSIENDYIENYSLNVARTWGIGQKDRNNGALLVVSVNDRKLRIEVGTGLEGDLTDSRSGQIIRNRITPAFKSGDYYKGISEGVDGIILAINAADDPLVDAPSVSSSDWVGIAFAGAYFFLIVLSWFGAMLGRSKRWWPGGVMGVVLGSGLGALLGSGLVIAAVSGFVIGFFGLLFDYLVSRNYHTAKATGHAPSWWAGGGTGSTGSGGFGSGGISGGFGGGGGFSGGGSSGSW
jgi:uncharacterized protein